MRPSKVAAQPTAVNICPLSISDPWLAEFTDAEPMDTDGQLNSVIYSMEYYSAIEEGKYKHML